MFIDRKYCGIVQDNSIGNYQIPPTSDRCQSVWRNLHEDLHDISDEIYNTTVIAKQLDPTRPSTATIPGHHLSDEDLEKVLLCSTNDNLDWIKYGPQIPLNISMVWFVDDVYVGGESKTHAIDCYSYAAHIYEGHHKLFDPNKNFTSWYDVNCGEHSDQRETSKKLLGYLFRQSTGLLHAVYEADLVPATGSMTKRKASSYLLSLYDPLGLILEQTMIGRLIWRSITEVTKDWDATITDDHRRQVSEVVDIVFITNYGDINWSIGNKMKSRWEGPYTIAKVPTSATIYKVIDFLKHKMVRVHLKMVNNINNNKMIMLSPKMINPIKPKTVTPSPMTTNWIKLKSLTTTPQLIL
ncbi:hypothetical protein FOZ63_030056 [Perkinsus olseni]|uniref:Reverse transcriptase domain-containing protein n=1 Tax=Perkinsus olseni TaxID=32597 RepID=A0A7J6S2K3_PEROL|nr:hypothetical protein FOZ63_030056 [Perkinsus olseni]